MKLTLANLLNGSFLKNLMPAGTKSAGTGFSDVLKLSVKEAPPSGKPLLISDELSPPVAKPAVSYLGRYRETNVESQVKLKLPGGSPEIASTDEESDAPPVRKIPVTDSATENQKVSIEGSELVKAVVLTPSVVSSLSVEHREPLGVKTKDVQTRITQTRENSLGILQQQRPIPEKTSLQPNAVSSTGPQPPVLQARGHVQIVNVPVATSVEVSKVVRSAQPANSPPASKLSETNTHAANDFPNRNVNAASELPKRQVAQNTIGAPQDQDDVDSIMPKSPQPIARRVPLSPDLMRVVQKPVASESGLPSHESASRTITNGIVPTDKGSSRSKLIFTQNQPRAIENQNIPSVKIRREPASYVIESRAIVDSDVQPAIAHKVEQVAVSKSANSKLNGQTRLKDATPARSDRYVIADQANVPPKEIVETRPKSSSVNVASAEESVSEQVVNANQSAESPIARVIVRPIHRALEVANDLTLSKNLDVVTKPINSIPKVRREVLANDLPSDKETGLTRSPRVATPSQQLEIVAADLEHEPSLDFDHGVSVNKPQSFARSNSTTAFKEASFSGNIGQERVSQKLPDSKTLPIADKVLDTLSELVLTENTKLKDATPAKMQLQERDVRTPPASKRHSPELLMDDSPNVPTGKPVARPNEKVHQSIETPKYELILPDDLFDSAELNLPEYIEHDAVQHSETPKSKQGLATNQSDSLAGEKPQSVPNIVSNSGRVVAERVAEGVKLAPLPQKSLTGKLENAIQPEQARNNTVPSTQKPEIERVPTRNPNSGSTPIVPLRKTPELERTPRSETPVKAESTNRLERPNFLTRDVAPLVKDYLHGRNVNELKPLSLAPKVSIDLAHKAELPPDTTKILDSDVLPTDNKAWVRRTDPKQQAVVSEPRIPIVKTDSTKTRAEQKSSPIAKVMESADASRAIPRAPVEQKQSLTDRSGEVSAKPGTTTQKSDHAPAAVTEPSVEKTVKHAQIVEAGFEQVPAEKPNSELKVSGTPASTMVNEDLAHVVKSEITKTETAKPLEPSVDVTQQSHKTAPSQKTIPTQIVTKDVTKPAEVVPSSKPEVSEVAAKHITQPSRPIQTQVTVESLTQRIPQAIPFVITPDSRTALPATERLFNKPVDRRDAQIESDRGERSSAKSEQRSASPAREVTSDAKQQSGADSQSQNNERENHHAGFRSTLDNIQPVTHAQAQQRPHATGQQGMTESLRVALQQALDMSRKRVVEPNELRLTVPLGELGLMDIDVVREADKFLIRIGADPQALAIMEEQRPQLMQWLRDNGYPVEQLDVSSRMSDQARSDLLGSDQSRDDRASNTSSGSRRSGDEQGTGLADEAITMPRPAYSGARVWTA